MLAPLVVFGLLECALRIAGYGYDTAFFKRTRIDGRDFLVNNDNFVLRFFPAQLARQPAAVRMEAEKPADTCRIFILGESAALGDPSPPYGAGRYLQALLSDRFPRKKFELVNVAITAINSHVIVPIARECARHDGDFWIIYMGNNEMVGPFGAASVFGAQAPPIWMVRLSLVLQETCVGQCLMSAARNLKFKSAESRAWAGMEMFMGQQVPPNDARKERVYKNFERNLRDILAAGLDSGARVILNTVAVNLKDCSPFASLSPSDAAEQFNLAQSLYQSTNYAAACEHFQKACDYDALPFRTDSTLNGLIRKAAQQSTSSNLLLFDAATALATNNPAGICGDETFLEHVHFNFDGNYHLARAWAEKMAPLLGEKAGSDWLAQEVCEQRLGLTDWNRAITLSEIKHRRLQAPLNSQINNERELKTITNQINVLRRRLDRAAVERAHALYVENIRRQPDDYFMLFNFADFLEVTGNWKETAAVWKQAQAVLPDYYLCWFQEGRMLERLGQLDQAESDFRRTVALYPHMAAAWIELGNIDTSEGRYESALAECQRAEKLEPNQSSFCICTGKVLARMNRPTEARQQFEEALQLDPGNQSARQALDSLK